jgi:hypothetical protein
MYGHEIKLKYKEILGSVIPEDNGFGCRRMGFASRKGAHGAEPGGRMAVTVPP